MMISWKYSPKAVWKKHKRTRKWSNTTRK